MKTFQIIEASNYSPKAIEIYEQIGQIHLGEVDDRTKQSVQCLIVRLAHRIDRQYLKNYDALECVVTPTTGLNHIDVDFCRQNKIQVFSLRNCKEELVNITSTSELTIGLLLALERKITVASADVIKKLEWHRDNYRGRQINGLTIGIVGLGRIGSHVARYASALGMSVVANDDFVSDEHFSAIGAKRQSMKNLLSNSDVITLHASFEMGQAPILGQEQIELMKSDAVIINTARGELLDEIAVANAITNGKLAGVATDVLCYENSAEFLEKSPLVKLASAGENVVITPHVGGCTDEAMGITEVIMAKYVVSEIFGDAGV